MIFILVRKIGYFRNAFELAAHKNGKNKVIGFYKYKIGVVW